MNNYLLPEDDGLQMRPCGAWTAIKLDYLARYINIFEKAMRGKWQLRNYIDLLAGPGKNRVKDTKKVFFGSPLVALTTTHPFTGYYFIEKDPNNKAALEKRCMSSPLYESLDIKEGDCNKLIDEVVLELRKTEIISLNMAFLDPQGMELEWNTVAKMASVKRMDLIIYYPLYGLTRNMPKLCESDGVTSIDNFFGGFEWRRIYLSNRHKPTLHRHLIDLYKSNLSALNYTEVFSGDENLGDEPLIRNQIKNSRLYHLGAFHLS